MNWTSFSSADAIWFYFQCDPQPNPRIVNELKVFVAAKFTFVHHFKIWGENICQNLNKGSAMWQLKKKNSVLSSAQIKLQWVV